MQSSSLFTAKDQTFTFNKQCIFTRTYVSAQAHDTQPNNADAHPIVLLHGWMDNLASFNLLVNAIFARTQTPLKLIAIDLPGHGKSDHITGLNAYNIWGDIACVMAIVNALHLPQFSLIGHSRGAMIATLLAGTFVDRIQHLVAIESIIPPFDLPTHAPKTLQQSVLGQLALLTKNQNYYSTFEKAVRARANGVVPVTEGDARILAHHGVVEHANGFYWHVDPMLKAPSEIKLTLEQIDAFFDAITAKISLILAQDGLILRSKRMTDWISTQPRLTPHILKGGHHLHMSQACGEVAHYIVSTLEK